MRILNSSDSFFYIFRNNESDPMPTITIFIDSSKKLYLPKLIVRFYPPQAHNFIASLQYASHSGTRFHSRAQGIKFAQVLPP